MATALAKPEMTTAEWEARQQLAACYRVFDMLGWSEMIYNHITLKVPDEEGAFLINPFGLHFQRGDRVEPGQDRHRRQQARRQPLSASTAPASSSTRCSTATCPTRIASCTRTPRRAWR